MNNYRLDPDVIEFYVLKGRKERSLAAKEFFSRRIKMVKKYLSKRKSTPPAKLQTSL